MKLERVQTTDSSYQVLQQRNVKHLQVRRYQAQIRLQLSQRQVSV